MNGAVVTDRDAVRAQPARSDAAERRRQTGRLVVLLGLVVGLVALTTRLYELRDVPRLTDETDEVMLGLAIARGQTLPLTNVDAYIGPLWNYLLAVRFVLVGPSSFVPRSLTTVAGLLTVVATGWLGWELALRLGWPKRAAVIGLGGALLLATSSFHAVVSSRLGWSHSLTPLALTLALACLIRWERTRDAWLLAGLGLGYGLAVQTHPTALAFGPGLLVWALVHWRHAILSRAGWLALGLFLLANLPMLAFNIATGFGSLQAAVRVQSAYAGGVATGPAPYGTNLVALLGSLPLLLSGDIGERRGAILVVDDPLHLVYAGLALIGLLVAARVRCWSPALIVLSAVVVLPALTGKFEPLFNGRYVAPILPLGLVAVAVGVVALVATVATVPPLRRVERPLTAGLLVSLTLLPLLALQGYVSATLRDGPNNRELYRALHIVAAVTPQLPVLMEASLSGTRVSTGREGTGVLDYLLQLDGRVAVRRYAANDLLRAAERGEGTVVIASKPTITRLEKDFVTELPPGEAEARQGRRAAFLIVHIVRPASVVP